MQASADTYALVSLSQSNVSWKWPGQGKRPICKVTLHSCLCGNVWLSLYELFIFILLALNQVDFFARLGSVIIIICYSQ